LTGTALETTRTGT